MSRDGLLLGLILIVGALGLFWAYRDWNRPPVAHDDEDDGYDPDPPRAASTPIIDPEHEARSRQV